MYCQYIYGASRRAVVSADIRVKEQTAKYRGINIYPIIKTLFNIEYETNLIAQERSFVRTFFDQFRKVLSAETLNMQDCKLATKIIEITIRKTRF